MQWPQIPSCFLYLKENNELILGIKCGSSLCSWLYITVTSSSEALPGDSGEGRGNLRNTGTLGQGVSNELWQHLLQPWAKGLLRIKGQKEPSDLMIHVPCRWKHHRRPFCKLSHVSLKPVGFLDLTTATGHSPLRVLS